MGFLGNVVLGADMLIHGKFDAATSMVPMTVGISAMATNKWLARYGLGEAAKFVGGALITYSAAKLAFSSMEAHDTITAISASFWSLGGVQATLLPFFGPQKQTRTKVQVIIPYTRSRKRLPKKSRKNALPNPPKYKKKARPPLLRIEM